MEWNFENLCYSDTHEYQLLESIDKLTDRMEKAIKEIKEVKEKIYFMIKFGEATDEKISELCDIIENIVDVL